MKISIVTVVFNAAKYLEDCIKSVLSQDYSNLEYVIIDGGSTDGTLEIIEKYRDKIQIFISEKDKGLYDAINKGIKLATGDVVGILNADDYYASNDVISDIALAFKLNSNLDGLYGNLNYIHPENFSIIRKWRSTSSTYIDIEKGWMPAHPTLYLKKNLFETFGYYSLSLGTAADYDLIIRFFHTHKIKTFFLDKLLVNMRMGGASNKSINAVFKAVFFDYRALKNNKVPFPINALFKKKASKVLQYL